MKFWAFKPRAEGSDEVELTVYGVIEGAAYWDDEVGAKQFAEDLKAHKDAARIRVRINSEGGDAFAGIAIYNMLKAHPSEILVTVEGLAGSAASIVAMAGDVTMALGSMMMVHNPWTITSGDANALRKSADTLDQLRDSLVSIYQAKTGMEPEALRELLDAETWLTAEAAVEQGFADRVDGLVVPEDRGDTVVFNSIRFPRGRVPQAALPPKPEAEEDDVPTTRDQLAEKAPDLLNALLAEGRSEERARMKAIDEVALPGYDALVQRARYDEPMSAECLAMEIVRAQKAAGSQRLQEMRADANDIDVPAAPIPVEASDDEEQEIEAHAAGIAAGARRSKR